MLLRNLKARKHDIELDRHADEHQCHRRTVPRQFDMARGRRNEPERPWQRLRSDGLRGSGVVLGIAWYDL